MAAVARAGLIPCHPTYHRDCHSDGHDGHPFDEGSPILLEELHCKLIAHLILIPLVQAGEVAVVMTVGLHDEYLSVWVLGELVDDNSIVRHVISRVATTDNTCQGNEDAHDRTCMS